MIFFPLYPSFRAQKPRYKRPSPTAIPVPVRTVILEAKEKFPFMAAVGCVRNESGYIAAGALAMERTEIEVNRYMRAFYPEKRVIGLF